MNVPEGHKLVTTADGSFTLFSEAFQEACHSMSGAREETLLHYVNGCLIRERAAEYDPFIILEVGFGLGIGLLTTMDHLPENVKWHFISLELDLNLLIWFKDQNKDHPLLKNLFWDKNHLRCKTKNFELTILQGHARVTLPEYVRKNQIKWHAIYQDAFSPKRNPDLWTKEWFEFLKENSHQKAILSTYSASTSVRKSLHESGWGVHKGDPFGQKRTSTRADLNSTTDFEILFVLERSPALSISDKNFVRIIHENDL